MTEAIPVLPTPVSLGRWLALVPIALVFSFLALLARLYHSDKVLSPLQDSLVLLAPLIALLVTIALTRRVSAVAFCALAPAALLYPIGIWFWNFVGGFMVVAVQCFLYDPPEPLRAEDAASIGFILCLIGTAIIPPVAAMLSDKGRATRVLFALYLAAYVPVLLVFGDLDRYFWRAVGRGGFDVTGAPLIRLAALVALGVMAFSRRKSRNLA